MGDRNGYWCVLETLQGGGIPEEIHGPYWDQVEAIDVASQFEATSRSFGRRDTYTVGYVETDLDDEESDRG